MKVAILGTQWGRVHVGTFRRWGHEIHALMGRSPEKTRQIADEEHVPVAATSPDELSEADIIVIATPARTHLEYIDRFAADKLVLCEKPLAGAPIASRLVKKHAHNPVFVNYAFPFLETARSLKQLVDHGHAGDVFRIVVNSTVNFPIDHSPVAWFLDVAVHPLAWLNHAFGDFELVQLHNPEGRANISTVLENGNQTLNMNLFQAPWTGLQYDITIVGTSGILRTTGGYQPEKGWNFTPITLNGEPVNAGEYSTAEHDIWFEANCQSVKTFLDVGTGMMTRDEALALGAFDFSKAAQIEQGLRKMLKDKA